MRTRYGILTMAMMVGVGTLAFSAPAGAEGGLTLEERVERLERRGETPAAAAAAQPSGLLERLEALEGRVKNFPFGMKLGGMVVTSYLYDFNEPDSDLAELRAFDRDQNTFSLDLAQLQFSRAPGDEGVGFMIKVDFGKVAERIASDWDGNGTVGNVAEEQNSVELQDAYITYNFPGLPELGIKAGKFATLLGAEVIESPLNPNISRSLAYSFAIPITNTGALASYAYDWVSLTMGVVNGWDNVIDSNDGKSFLGSLAVTPVEQFAFSVNGIYGPEQADEAGPKRGVLDVIATIKPIENLLVSLNYDYGSETNLTAAAGDTAEWNAFSGIIGYDLVDVLPVPVGFALRGEYFDDSDGTRLTLGTTAPGVPAGHYQNDWEVTGTFKVVLAEGLMLRAEYRYDQSKNDLFDYKRGLANADSQQTVAGELSYVF